MDCTIDTEAHSLPRTVTVRQPSSLYFLYDHLLVASVVAVFAGTPVAAAVVAVAVAVSFDKSSALQRPTT